MEISANYNQAQSIIDSEIQAQQTEALYQVKLLKMQQGTQEVVGDLLQDTAEISAEAIERFMAEVKAQ